MDNAKLYHHFTQIACYFYLDYNHVLKFGYTYGLRGMIKKLLLLFLKNYYAESMFVCNYLKR